MFGEISGHHNPAKLAHKMNHPINSSNCSVSHPIHGIKVKLMRIYSDGETSDIEKAIVNSVFQHLAYRFLQ